VSDPPVRDQRPAPIPLAFLTGFLGAGKTSLLNRLLPDPHLSGTLVVVNEYGETPLDHLLTQAAANDIVLLPSGCLCCAVRGDLVAALEDLLRRRDNGHVAPFARVIVETSGLADPVPAMAAVLRHPYLAIRYRLDALVTVVDAVNGARTIAGHHAAAAQVVHADRLVVTKSDLGLPQSCPALDAGGLRATLARLNPTALILDAARGEATASALFDLDPARETLRAATILLADQPSTVRHRDDVTSFALRSDEPAPAGAAELLIDMLRASSGPDLLRVKGLVALEDDPARPLLVQAAQHLVHPPRRLPAWPDGDRSTRLVFITRGLDPAFVAGLWDALTEREGRVSGR